jgi:hypothetical protein
MCRFLLIEDVNMFGTLTLCNKKTASGNPEAARNN